MPAAQSAASLPSTQLVDCMKCDGRGRINAFAHVVAGRCFDCEGAGKISIDRISETEAFEIMVGNLYYTAGAVLSGSFMNDGGEYSTHYLRGMVADMFKVGRVIACEVLNHIGQGRYWDARANDFRQADPATALALRDELKALGQAALAARREQAA